MLKQYTELTLIQYTDTVCSILIQHTTAYRIQFINIIVLVWSTWLVVNVSLQVLDVLRVDDKKFSVSLSMYFGVQWTEDRMKLPAEGSNFTVANWLPIDLEFMKNLWIPNVFVYNLNSFTALDCLKKLAGLWIVEDRDFFYNQVMTLDLIDQF